MAARSRIKSLLIRVAPIGEAIAERAARLRASHPMLRLPDALVIATGVELGADVILTGDRRWQRVHKRIVVVH